MTRALKQILLDIARLSSSDQKWILASLSPEHRTLFEQQQGLELLTDARRFRKVKQTPLLLTESPSALPDYCQQLATKTPLYIAIVIEQCDNPWKASFLQQFDQNGIINTLLNNEVRDIKPLVKQAIAKEWESSLTFEAHLERNHG